MRWRGILAAAVVGILAASCAGSPSTQLADGAETGGVARAGLAVGDASASAAPAAAPGVDPESYRIGALDVLEIVVFQAPELTRTVQVGATGQVSLPLIGGVEAGGKTAHQVEGEIAARLRAKYLNSPQVTIYIKEYNSQRVTVEGAVKKPGVFPIAGRMSLLQAVALAQGFDDFADQSNVVVFRHVGGQRTAAKFDVNQIRAGKAPDARLQAGDMIVVDRSGVRSALHEVLKVLPIAGVFMMIL